MKRPAGPCYPEFMNQTGNFSHQIVSCNFENLFELDNTLGPCSTLNAVVILKISLAPVFRVKSFEPDCLLCLKHSHIEDQTQQPHRYEVNPNQELRTLFCHSSRERENLFPKFDYTHPHIFMEGISTFGQNAVRFSLSEFIWVFPTKKELTGPEFSPGHLLAVDNFWNPQGKVRKEAG